MPRAESSRQQAWSIRLTTAASVMTAFAAVELMFALVSTGAYVGVAPEGPTREDFARANYWWGLLARLIIIVVLLAFVGLVHFYPRSRLRAVLRNAAIVGFGLLQVAYVFVTTRWAIEEHAPSQFVHTVLGSALIGCSGLLIWARPRPRTPPLS